ncbi:glycosyltransferase family 2 protein [Crocosphaera sp. Alani8]|uniref:glycosyltransferase family 2 protein n=1 Tax=Crocosphaera sp. Alani8 TaxID=3038952 RepID=UPI00313B33BB
MTKLIIQIPCYNEESSLPITLADLPRQIPGIDQVEWLIINDGSQDRTVEVAKEWHVDHIVNFEHNQGLAKAFMAGLEASLTAGADVIVNTDADNQYCAEDIPKLIEPILNKRSEIVVGARPIENIRHFSPTKKLLQKLGSWVVRMASGTEIPDAPSGFRAMSRSAAMKLNVFNEYTYTLETIIQAGRKDIIITSVPIRTNGYLRASRLVKSIPAYIQRSIITIFRIFMTYQPLKFFTFLGAIPFLLGNLIFIRWLILFVIENSTRTRLPSLLLGSILVIIGVQIWILGLVADILAVNRKLLEDIQLRLRRNEYEKFPKD